MSSILHIASHYGGGVGSVMNAWKEQDTQHQHRLTYLNQKEPNVGEAFDPSMLSAADLAIVHVWNHPSLFELLLTGSLPECRLVGWSHTNGLNPPYVLSPNLVGLFDRFLYTSPVSGLEHPAIWSTRGVEQFLGVERKAGGDFTVGYIGTLDFAKLHPRFIEICAAIIQKIPDVRFIIVGDGGDRQTLTQSSLSLGIDQHFTFTGLVRDIKPYLESFDVFLYPLNETHFGTCEQVLGEAMAAGVPCVCLDNEPEKIIIANGVDGYLTSYEELADVVFSIHEYGSGVSNCARQKAKQLYSINAMIGSWGAIIEAQMQLPAATHTYEPCFPAGISPGAHAFCESLGAYGVPFYENNVNDIKELMQSNLQWKSSSKGSPKQYSRYFPDDSLLRRWVELL